MESAINFDSKQGQVAFFNNSTFLFQQTVTNNNGENNDTTPFDIRYLTIGPNTKISIYNVKDGFNSLDDGNKMMLIDNSSDEKMIVRLTNEDIRENGYMKSYKIYTFEGFSKKILINNNYVIILILIIIFLLFIN